MIKYIQFKILITKEYLLQCSIIDLEKNETIIKLTQIHSESNFYTPSIHFENNFIKVCEVNDKSIHFMKQWVENPGELIVHTIQFQNKEYQILHEVLFGIIINEFKQIIEKEYIIENTVIDIPSNNCILSERIITSLEAIGLKNIEVRMEENSINFENQGELLSELLEKKLDIEKKQRMIERAKQLNISEEQRQKLEEINLNNDYMFEDDEFNREVSNKFTLNERNNLNLSQLDNYCIFIASRYFDSLEDHQNLTKVSRRLKRNMEKFHYNPISLTLDSINLFPNVETLHIYNENDEFFIMNRIAYYVVWNKVSYNKFKKVKNEFENNYIDLNIVDFKRITWMRENTIEEYEKQDPNESDEDGVNWSYEDDWDFVLTIPESVNELHQNCFHEYENNLIQLTIPSTVTTIPQKCLENCSQLTNITLPLNENQFICGNKIYTTKNNHFDQFIYLPKWIQIINGNKVEQITSITIPSTITSIDENCFYNFFQNNKELKQIIIPESVKDIPQNALINLFHLKEMIISNEYSFDIGKMFYSKNQTLNFVYLPESLREINGKYLNPLTSITIPSDVTKLSDYCFANCSYLREIKGIENIKEFGKGCFFNCSKRLKERYPEVNKNIEEYLNEVVKENHRKQIEEWTRMKYNGIIFNSDVDNWSIYTSVFNKRISQKKQLIFLIEDTDGNIFGYYLNTQFDDNIFHCGMSAESDSKTFHFNLQTKYYRLPGPMKFEIKDSETRGYKMFDYWNFQKSGGYCCFSNNHESLITLGDIHLFKENDKNQSYCNQDGKTFNYYGIENALRGYQSRYNNKFIPKRILVIQMKESNDFQNTQNTNNDFDFQNIQNKLNSLLSNQLKD